MRRLSRVLDDSTPDVDDSPGIQSRIRIRLPSEASTFVTIVQVAPEANVDESLQAAKGLTCVGVAKVIHPSPHRLKHFLHPEDKSLGPEGEACNEYTRGLLKRRPVLAMLPFEYIGKEVERRGQEGEDPSILEKGGPIRYGSGRKAKTRSAEPALIEKARRYGLRQLMRESGETISSQRARTPRHSEEAG